MIERAETILNVDDTEAIRYAKTRTLRRAGFTVVEAGTGAEALRLATEARPDLAVLDVKLPDISGLEVCKAIKRDFPGTLVLQASASFVETSDRVRGLDSGADSYLTEPVHPEELVAAVRALLRLRRAEKALRESDARVRSILETVPDAMVVIDQRGTIESFSTGAVCLFGYPAEEAAGQRVGMLRICRRNNQAD